MLWLLLRARAMAAVIEPLMSGQGAPWMLYGIGAVISIVLTFCGVSALAFALGMFIPLQLNLPLIVGGFVNWYINSRSSDVQLNQRRNEKRHTPRFRFYRWWCVDGSCKCRYAIRRTQFCQCRIYCITRFRK